MRTQTLRVLDGKVDLTQAVLAKVKSVETHAAAVFLRDYAGATPTLIKELFGIELPTDSVHSIAEGA
jgi:hypothetical protein